MTWERKRAFFFLLLLIVAGILFSQTQMSFLDLKVEDCPNDGGTAFCITWKRFKNEIGENVYKIYYVNDKGETFLVEQFPDNQRFKTEWKRYFGKKPNLGDYHAVIVTHLPKEDKKIPVVKGTLAKFFIEYTTKDGKIIAKSEIYKAESKVNWFNKNLFYVLLFLFIFAIVLLYYLWIGRKGRAIFIRRIAGLDAIEDALGRATEMGRPILYCTGLAAVSGLSTIASLSILSQVVKRLALYGTRLLVPCYDPIVMSAAQEVAKNSYLQAGRPDLYRPKDIAFITNSQFAYVASVNEMMMREKTATNFYIGSFAAEALLLSETGAANKSIQIAGTDSIAQLPFFVVTCDYTLIGEELYAAGAYISKDPMLLSTLKSQDIFKILLFVVILFECIINSFNMQLFKYIFYVS